MNLNTRRLCFSCHTLQEIAYVDPIDRGYCSDCVITLPIGSAVRAMGFLSLTIPFKVGNRVHAYTAGELYDGIGHVTEVSIDLEHGTPVEPTFRVAIDEPADELLPAHADYLATQLRAAGRDEHILAPVG
jgi:hypothetical protein